MLASYSVDAEELNDLVTDDPQVLLDDVCGKLLRQIDQLDEEMFEILGRAHSANFQADIYEEIPEHPRT